MKNCIRLKLSTFIFISILFSSCNIKHGIDASKDFYNVHKVDLSIISDEFGKFKNINSITLNDLRDSSNKMVNIDNLSSSEISFVNKVRDFLRSTSASSVKKSHNDKLILFHLGIMDGIAYKVSEDSYIDLHMAFAKTVVIENSWFYFLEKTI